MLQWHAILSDVKNMLYDNYRNKIIARSLATFHCQKADMTHEFIVYAMRQQGRAENLAICYHKKQTDVSFSGVCPVIHNEFRHNIVKVVCRCTRLPP